MARVLILLALCVVLPAFVAAARAVTKHQCTVQGRVYCDTCKAGFETPKSIYIPGAKVKIECKDRKTNTIVYRKEGETDATGTYYIPVSDDHKDQVCDAVLVSSPLLNCNKPTLGRDRARVVLTSENGIASTTRFANNMGFTRHEPLAGCDALLKSYQEAEY